MGDLIIARWNDTDIQRRVSDDYVNATLMCKANGRLWADFFRLEQSQRYLEALSVNMGIPIFSENGLVQSRRGRNGGTWVHPDVATELARWISADFGVFVNQWFRRSVIEQQQQPVQVPLLTPADKLETIRSAYDLLQGLGMVDERDKLNLADAVRDVVAELGGSKNLLPVDEEMTISDAWMKVTGKRANRNALKEIGRFAAKSYRSEFGREPATRNQYVDGVVRSVKSYRRSWLVPLLEEHMDLFAN